MFCIVSFHSLVGFRGTCLQCSICQAVLGTHSSKFSTYHVYVRMYTYECILLVCGVVCVLCMYVCTYMYPARLVILSLGIKGSYWSTYIHYVLGYNTDLISDVPCIKRLLFLIPLICYSL